MKSTLEKKLATFRASLNSSSGWGGAPWQMKGTRTWGRWMESPEDHFRKAGFADEIISIRHNGWYTTNEQDELTRGIVFQLVATKGGCERFIVGALDPCNDGPVIIEVRENGMPYIYEEKEDAASNADSFAEKYGESCREDDAEQRAKMLQEDLAERNKTLKADIADLCRDMRAAQATSSNHPAICSALWRTIKACRSQMHQNAERIASLKDNYWNAVQS